MLYGEFMKVPIYLIIFLQICLQMLPMQANDLQALEAQREIHRLVKIKLYGEPLSLAGNHYSATKSLAFSPDGKQLAIAYSPGSVLIYDLVAEKAKRFDREVEKMKKELKESELAVISAPKDAI